SEEAYPDGWAFLRVCGVKTAGLNVLCRPDKRSASRTSQHHRVQSNILSLHNTSHPAVYAVN
ncbi:TPA: hypothetical protein ACPFO5_005306, partial [Citrobacter freundii]